MAFEGMLPYCWACENQEWSLHLWSKSRTGEDGFVVPFKCRSWRHEGECRQWKGAQDFRRIQAAMRTRTDWVYVVLTYRRADYPNKRELYRAGVTHWAKLRKRIEYAWGPCQYVQTWEQHKSGWPHVNIMLGNSRIFEQCQNGRWKAFRRHWMETNAVECGFGERTWVEPVKRYNAMAGYLVKLAKELTGADHKNQLPTDAPAHFRRIRASRGLLPKPFSKGNHTGRMLFCPAHWASDIAGCPVVLPDPDDDGKKKCES